MNKNIEKTFEYIKEFCNDILFNKLYFLSIIFISVLSYGFSIFNRTISIDDMSKNIYLGDGKLMLKGCRWGQYIWMSLFSSKELSPFVDRFFALVFLILSAFIISTLLYKLTNCRNVWPYTIFSCLYISFALNNEIWEYVGAGTLVWGGIFVSTFVVLYLFNIEKNGIVDIAFTGLLLTIVVSSYESAIFVYVALVSFSLLIDSIFGENNNWIKKCLVFIYPLILSIVLRYVIGFVLIKLNDLTFANNGDSELRWGQYGIVACIKGLYEDFICYYVYNAKYYAPIRLFILSSIAYVLICIFKCKKINNYILAILSYLSIFLLAFLRGDNLSYRFAQTIQLFVAIVGFIVAYLVSNSKKHTALKQVLCIILFSIISIRQGITCNQILALNNQRSENEARTIQYIGSKLYSEYDISKEVVFCGQYHLGDNIQKQISIDGDEKNGEFIDTNVNSCLKWSTKAFGSQSLMKEYFSYYGYDINVSSEEFTAKTNKEYEQIAINNNMKPLSIKDMGDYILVYFGEIID